MEITPRLWGVWVNWLISKLCYHLEIISDLLLKLICFFLYSFENTYNPIYNFSSYFLFSIQSHIDFSLNSFIIPKVIIFYLFIHPFPSLHRLNNKLSSLEMIHHNIDINIRLTNYSGDDTWYCTPSSLTQKEFNSSRDDTMFSQPSSLEMILHNIHSHPWPTILDM